ncbi:hypothetical protein FRC06_011296 [Ceratobasidium sp. 370]|nr:hypothetical protein FRC06_011296 [Ceratobasidium sp. 370]
MATSHSGMPHIHANSQANPTEHEREMRAQAKAADHMLKLETNPKCARRGLCIPGKLSKKTAKLLLIVGGVYRKLVAAASGGQPLGSTSSESHGNLEADLLPDDKEERAARAAEAAGKELSCRRKRKPSLQDIHGYEKQILTMAKMHLLATMLIEGPYQTCAWLMKVAKMLFIETWRQELPEVSIQLPSEEVLQVHGFEFLKWDSSPKIINCNLKIFSAIHPNTFHCTEFDPTYGHYEGSLLTKAIAAALFGGPYSVGITFHDYFEPMPLTTVTFILVNMQFCIKEWETGQWVSQDLSTSNMLNKYVAHLRGLMEAHVAARGRISCLQDHWFAFGFEYSGAVPVDEPIYQPITLRSEVCPDTLVFDDDDPTTKPALRYFDNTQ